MYLLVYLWLKVEFVRKTQDKSILKCTYVLNGTTYEKLWHQNKCCDVHFHVFLACEITKFFTKSKKRLLSVAINHF